MLTSSTLILAIVSALSAVFATPLDARQSAECSPNFEGAGLRVNDATGRNQLGVRDLQVASPLGSSSFRGPSAVDWHFQQTGQPTTSYIIKDVANNNLAVTSRSDGSVQLRQSSDSGNDPNQIWTVSCTFCATGISGLKNARVASGCTIRSPAQAGGCLYIGPTPNNVAYIQFGGACPSLNFFTGN